MKQQIKRPVKRAWRAVSRRLPPSVANAIRVPSKRLLRGLGLMRRPAPPRPRPVRARTHA